MATSNLSGKAVRRRSYTPSSSHHQPYPPRDARSLTSSNRRRSTSGVFAKTKQYRLSFAAEDAASNETKEQKLASPTKDSAIDREIQHEASELNGTEAEIAEAREREELEDILSRDKWGPSEAALFTRLRRRGREPLLPASWRLDFSTFPEVLYSPVSEPSFIGAFTPSMEFRGSQALQRLVNVGGQVRDRTEINPSAPVEPLIYHEIKKFLAWAEKDAEISMTSILTVTCNRDKKGTSKGASERTEKKMKTMAEALQTKHPRPALSKIGSNTSSPASNGIPALPTVVYGITVYNCVAAISTLNCEKEIGDVKTLVVLDWTDVGLDIWNAIAIAILIITCRNDILDSDEEARLEPIQHPDDDA